MQKHISTNIHLPDDLWKAAKIKAAEEGCSLKDLVVRGLRTVLGMKLKRPSGKKAASGLLALAGKAKAGPKDLALNHDRYLYDK